MRKPDIPDNDVERLKALNSYGVLDTLPESDYDDITKIAAEICDSPMALITLVDKDRQFFKSKIGVEVVDSPRDYSFCSHAINEPNHYLEIEDTSQDERFFDNPYVKGNPNIVFYAGVNLINPDGYPLGTLCVLDNKAKKLSSSQKWALQSLAKQIMNILELRKKNILLEKTQIELNNYARDAEDFVYAASHDMKEPVRMVRSFLKLLKEKQSHNLDEKGKSYLDFAMGGAKRMDTMLKDVLIFYQLNLNSEEQVTVDLNKLVSEIKDYYSSVDADVTIEAVPLPLATGVKGNFRQLFQNLIGNAIKYNREGVSPKIWIAVEEMENHWQFEVRDNGIGIHEDKWEDVFVLFKRLNANTKIPGTGMGLSICRKIVAKAGGRIWVKSEVGQGTSFFWTWPKFTGY